MTQSFLLYAPKLIFDFLLDVIYFLPWWYSKGLVSILKKTWNSIIEKENDLAIFVWIKNIHKPLVGDYNWQGIAKSILLRIGQIILRSAVLIFWIFFSIIKVLLYTILPILVIWQIFYQLYFIFF